MKFNTAKGRRTIWLGGQRDSTQRRLGLNQMNNFIGVIPCYDYKDTKKMVLGSMVFLTKVKNTLQSGLFPWSLISI